MIGTSTVEIWRGDTIESQHRLHIAVFDSGGALRAHSGNPQLVTFARSAIKPLQALPSVRAGTLERFDLSDRPLALACASPGGAGQVGAGRPHWGGGGRADPAACAG